MNISADYAFVHGGGQGGWVWDETIDALKSQTGGAFGRALALDAPGCGKKRGRATENLKMADVAREMVADIEAAGLRDVILVGHSQAGQALPAMAAIRPGLFSQLIYVTCSAVPAGQNVGQMMGSGVHGSNQDEVGWPLDPATASISERMKLMFCNDMAPDQASAFLAKLGMDEWPPQTYIETDWRFEHLGAIPATFITCLQDLALPVPWQEIFAKRFRVNREVRIDAGHQVMNTRPQALAEVLLNETRIATSERHKQ